MTTSRRTIRGTTSGQSEILSVVFLIALTITGTAVIVVAGTATLGDSSDQASFERVENAMTSFDSRSSKVALGSAPVQTIDFGATDDGQYTVDSTDGWIRVVHDNHTAGSDDTETIYNESLGSVIYRNGDTSIAYQGGGVWRHDGEGSVVVSPPEFHYRDQTLTLPLVVTNGSDTTAGSTKAIVSRGGSSTQVYPDPQATYDGTTRTYRNPVQQGTVNVTVQSRYYEAWAEYFRTKTEGTVTVDHGNETVTLALSAGGTSGDFEMPGEGSAIDVRGLASDHSVENFTITLFPDESDAAEFDNLQWAMYVDSGSYQMEFHLRKGDEIAGVDRCRSNQVDVTVYFSDENGNRYHGWHKDNAFTASCTDRTGDGVADETRLDVNFTSNVTLEMTDLSNSDLTHFNPSGDTRPSNYTFDEHQSGVSWEPKTYDASDDTAPIYRLTNHYFARLGPNFDLVVDDKNSDTVQEDESYGTLEYEAEGKVTYMHVTQNRIDVRLRPA